jgi:hypothetical protein
VLQTGPTMSRPEPVFSGLVHWPEPKGVRLFSGQSMIQQEQFGSQDPKIYQIRVEVSNI